MPNSHVNPLSIAIVHPSIRVLGGAENIILWLGTYLARRGHQVKLICSEKSRYMEDLFESAGVKVVSIKLPFVPAFDPLPRHVWAMSRVLRRHLKNVDVINVHNFPATHWLVQASDFGQKKLPPILWTCHEHPRFLYAHMVPESFKDAVFDEDDLDHPVHFKKGDCVEIGYSKIVETDQALKSLFSRIVCNSEFTCQQVRTIYGVDPQVKRFGIPMPEGFLLTPDEKRTCVQQDSKFVIGLVSRLELAKNIHTALLAVRKLCQRFPHLKDKFVLRVVGTGSFEAQFKRYSERLGLSRQVVFEGFLTEQQLHEAYQQFRVLLYIPIREPLGLTPIEAALRRTPAVASHEGGPSETVIDGKTGWLVSPFDADQVAGVLAEAIQNPEQCLEKGNLAFEHARVHYNFEETGSFFEQNFHDLVGA